jgi:hypothetical protein
MKKIYLLTTFLVSIISSFGQPIGNTMTLKSDFFGLRFYQNDKKMNFSQAAKVMQENEQAYNYIRSARTNNTWSTIIGSIGGFMLGYTLGTSLGGGDPNWVVGGIGAGLIVAGIPLTIQAKKQAQNAVLTYNEGLKSSSFRKTELNLSVTSRSMGLRFHF